MKYRQSIFLVTCTEHACQVSNYFLLGISLRPGKWLKHLFSVLKIVVTTDILITESFPLQTVKSCIHETCRPINLHNDFCC